MKTYIFPFLIVFVAACDEGMISENGQSGATPMNDDASASSSTVTWYRDSDGDGFGDPDYSKSSTTKPSGYVGNWVDCDDDDEDVNPIADEVCNGVDDNCNDLEDDDDPYLADGDEMWWDHDQDGFGAEDSDSFLACESSDYFADNDDDCDDADNDNSPDMDEICDDDEDNDCDGTTDESSCVEIGDGTSGGEDCWDDDDDDGFGDPDQPVDPNSDGSCPSSAADNNDDCDDTRDTINPDADDDDSNGVDDDCDGDVDNGGTSSGAIEVCFTPNSYYVSSSESWEFYMMDATSNDQTYWFGHTPLIKGTGRTKVCEDIDLDTGHDYKFNGWDSTEVNYFVKGCSTSSGAQEYSSGKCLYGTITVDGVEVDDFASDSYNAWYEN